MYQKNLYYKEYCSGTIELSKNSIFSEQYQKYEFYWALSIQKSKMMINNSGRCKRSSYIIPEEK